MDSSFLIETGRLVLRESLSIGPKDSRAGFENLLNGSIKPRETGEGYFLYGPFELFLWGKRFVAGVRFHYDDVQSVNLTWRDGPVARLGYDAQQNDLLSEKKTLVKTLNKVYGLEPTDTSLGADCFVMSWGVIEVVADLKSTWCGMVLQYERMPIR